MIDEASDLFVFRRYRSWLSENYSTAIKYNQLVFQKLIIEADK